MVVEKGVNKGKREADLPNAFLTPSQGGKRVISRQLEIDKCPDTGKDRKDKLLGCAVMFLVSGSEENFISLLNTRDKL